MAIAKFAMSLMLLALLAAKVRVPSGSILASWSAAKWSAKTSHLATVGAKCATKQLSLSESDLRKWIHTLLKSRAVLHEVKFLSS